MEVSRLKVPLAIHNAKVDRGAKDQHAKPYHERANKGDGSIHKAWDAIRYTSAAERQIVNDRRRKKAIDEAMDAVKVIMSGIPTLAVVRSTILFGEAWIESVMQGSG